MSFPQGTAPFNPHYFDSLTESVSFTVDCPGLQRIFTQATNSVNATIAAATSQLSLVTTDFNALAASITALENQIATMAGSQASFSAVSIQASTVGSAVDIASVIAYLNAQATVMVSLGNNNALTFIKQLITLEQDLTNVTTAYSRLQSQINSLETMLVDLPARLTTLTSQITAKAATIPHCTIS